MTDDTDNDVVCLSDPFGYDDVISQRVTAFAQLAALTSTIKDDEIRELSVNMLRKINASIKIPSSATLTVINEKKKLG